MVRVKVAGIAAAEFEAWAGKSDVVALVSAELFRGFVRLTCPSGPVEVGVDVGDGVTVATLAAHDDDHEALLDRLIRALMGEPGVTPTASEYWMMMARSAARRSSSRKIAVGSALVRNGSLLAVGSNEVPSLGGDLAWFEDDPDIRDYLSFGVPEYDRRQMVASLVNSRDDVDGPANEERQFGEIYGLIDVDRAVHAEVAALADAARRGLSTQNGVVYVSHRPCYRCVRTMTAFGVASVVFDQDILYRVPQRLKELLSTGLPIAQFGGVYWDSVKLIGDSRRLVL